MKNPKLSYLLATIASVATALLPICAFAAPQILFEADFHSGTIFKFTPDGIKTTFATGLNHPFGLAFDAAGNLFEADDGSGTIFKFTPAGTKTTFATELSSPIGLAFSASGNLLVSDSGTIFKFTPTG